MAVKRLFVLFEGNSLHIDAEEDELQKVMKMFVTAKQSGQLNNSSVIWSGNYCICLDKVVSMAIGPAGATPQEQIIQIMRKETEQDEPWKQSLRPDSEEEDNI